MVNGNRFKCNARHRWIRTFFWCGLFLSFVFLMGCDSSDTRSTAKNATSGTFEIKARITAPVDGVTIAFVGGESNVTFNSTSSGGTAPLGNTWRVKGPTTENTSTGSSPTIQFLELGVHTVTLVVQDAAGLTASDSITVTLVTGESGVTTPTTTTSTTTTSTTTTTAATTTTT